MVKENPFEKPDVEGAEGGPGTRALLCFRLEGPEQDLLLRLPSKGGKWSDLSCEEDHSGNSVATGPWGGEWQEERR